MLKRRLALAITFGLLSALLTLAWRRTISSGDAWGIRQLILRENAILQAGDGARFDGLIYYPSMLEKTAALGLARAVVARNQYLRSVAKILGPSAALQVARRLPYLREFDDSAIESCKLVKLGNEVEARFVANYSIRVIKTAEGWKIDPFVRPFTLVIVENNRAIAAFNAARTTLERSKIQSSDEALRSFTGRF